MLNLLTFKVNPLHILSNNNVKKNKTIFIKIIQVGNEQRKQRKFLQTGSLSGSEANPSHSSFRITHI